MKGTYLLIMMLPEETSVLVGKKGVVRFQKGWYVYVGSAMNGLDQRIQRHLRKQKKIHWHIDYLLPHTQINSVFIKETKRTEECRIAHILAESFEYIPGFGCSDCACPSHLFTGFPQKILRVIASLGMRRYHPHTNP
jgi:Uri superfamily endonuclease